MGAGWMGGRWTDGWVRIWAGRQADRWAGGCARVNGCGYACGCGYGYRDGYGDGAVDVWVLVWVHVCVYAAWVSSSAWGKQ